MLGIKDTFKDIEVAAEISDKRNRKEIIHRFDKNPYLVK
ncbi:hypothetical protein MIDIC_20063 [Alphaproteobacteria bacterium]